MGPPPGIEAMMQMAMQSMLMGGPPGMGMGMGMSGGTVRITRTTDANGHVTIRQQVLSSPRPPMPMMLGDDDDDDDIPPEIKALLHLTDDMHSKASGKKKPVERKDESHEDIMKRMNSLSEEIGERHDSSKYELSDTGKERVFQMAIAGAVFLLLGLVSLVVSCQNKGQQDDDGRPSGRKVYKHNQE